MLPCLLPFAWLSFRRCADTVGLLILMAAFRAAALRRKCPGRKRGRVRRGNGNLTGWMYLGKGTGPFSVQDGAIHYKGGNGWLCYTEKEYPDFELRCEFELIKKGGDGGIFFRLERCAGGEVAKQTL